MDKLEREPHIAAVIFDLDGVIANTVYYHYLSWQQLADEEGIPFDKHTHDEGMLGLNREDALQYLLGNRTIDLSLIQQQLLLNRKNDYYLQLINELNYANLLPGIGNLLVELHAAGVKIALGSSSKNAELVLQRLKIRHFFDFLADGNSVLNLKPCPDVFLHAAESLRVAPTNCLVVEDAPAGIEAGLAAGMWVLGVGPYERLARSHLVLPTLAGIGWADIVAKVDYYHKSGR
ncbi:beta-phosphoglucomutase [Chamaesiphon minutus]|uniref:Beta-phosphoglucomutase n=1 Tax=Chamaesiphon minutus (strain ATCC 27169 / PCC 6605) TaxID=1173020 RepID=K9UJ46_CHAP6|nr:beta-phosphoglucomutase [Chamaesiphon minutus]AFY94805.1 beta-phosphoglucomutase [Chamaesiphon minutus PCC 6605]